MASTIDMNKFYTDFVASLPMIRRFLMTQLKSKQKSMKSTMIYF